MPFILNYVGQTVCSFWVFLHKLIPSCICIPNTLCCPDRNRSFLDVIKAVAILYICLVAHNKYSYIYKYNKKIKSYIMLNYGEIYKCKREWFVLTPS